jgi:hypothetical protein
MVEITASLSRRMTSFSGRRCGLPYSFAAEPQGVELDGEVIESEAYTDAQPQGDAAFRLATTKRARLCMDSRR